MPCGLFVGVLTDSGRVCSCKESITACTAATSGMMRRYHCAVQLPPYCHRYKPAASGNVAREIFQFFDFDLQAGRCRAMKRVSSGELDARRLGQV